MECYQLIDQICALGDNGTLKQDCSKLVDSITALVMEQMQENADEIFTVWSHKAFVLIKLQGALSTIEQGKLSFDGKVKEWLAEGCRLLGENLNLYQSADKKILVTWYCHFHSLVPSSSAQSDTSIPTIHFPAGSSYLM